MINHKLERVCYIESPDSKSVLTAATRITDDRSMIAVAFAFAPKKLFTRHQGRHVAFGRLNSARHVGELGSHYWLVPFKGHSSDAVVECFNDLQENLNISKEMWKREVAYAKIEPPHDFTAANGLLPEVQCVPQSWKGYKMTNTRDIGIDLYSV